MARANRTPLGRHPAVDDIIDRSTIDLLAAYGQELSSGADEVTPDNGAEGEVEFAGIVGFGGEQLRGTLVLAPSTGIASASRQTDEELRDWVGELANQLLGRIKNQLLRYGIEIYVTTPLVIRGQQLSPMPRVQLTRRVFEAGAGKVSVWFDADVEGHLELTESPDMGPSAVEGDALLF